MTRSAWPKAALAALLPLSLLACATLQGFAKPELTLVNLRWKDFTVLESTIELEVRLSNENPETLVVDGGLLNLYLDGDLIGKGSTGETFEIPRLESVTQKFLVHVSHLNAIHRIKTIHENKRVDYAIKGELYVRRGSGTTKVKVAQVGDLDMRDFARSAASGGEGGGD